MDLAECKRLFVDGAFDEVDKAVNWIFSEVDRLTAELKEVKGVREDLRRKYDYHQEWARDVAKELGCGDAARYRNDAIDGIMSLKRQLTTAHEERDRLAESIRVQRNAVKSLQMGYGNGYVAGLAGTAAGKDIETLQGLLKAEKEARLSDNADLTEQAMAAESALTTAREEGRKSMRVEALKAAESKGGWLHLPTVKAICCAIEAIPSTPPVAEGVKETCEWVLAPNKKATYLTGCGNTMMSSEPPEEEDECVNCGKPITIKPE